MNVSHRRASPAVARRCDTQPTLTRRAPGPHGKPCVREVHRLAPPRPSRLIALAVSLASLGSTHAQATAAAETYACQPSLSIFCRNIHVSCAGATRIPTAKFKVTVSGAEARVQTHGTAVLETGQAFRGKAVLIELSGSNDWIRIEPSGRYSHRIYRRGQAAMSYGTCRLRTR